MNLNVFVLLTKEKLFFISAALLEMVRASKDTVTLSEGTLLKDVLLLL